MHHAFFAGPNANRVRPAGRCAYGADPRPAGPVPHGSGHEEAAGLRRALRARTPDDDGLIDLASNDYLGLARDERLVEAAVAATRAWGTGSTGSRLVTGSTALHARLETRLRAFTGAEGALVFSSGYLANLAAVAALGGDALVVSEAGNHASIVDACRLSRSRVVVTPHRDVVAVEKALAGRDEEHAIVVTDAVFSVDGDLAPLAELHAATVRQGALLVVDEAHSIGVVGARGQGAAHAAGLAAEPGVVRTITLSKSLGSQGGAVLGAPEVIQTLVDTGRSFIFDTGLAPGSVAAALAAVDILHHQPELPGRVRARARSWPRWPAISAWRPAIRRVRSSPSCSAHPRPRFGRPHLCGTRGARRMLPAALGAGRPLLPAVDGTGQSEFR